MGGELLRIVSALATHLPFQGRGRGGGFTKKRHIKLNTLFQKFIEKDKVLNGCFL
jgi:hypothetical protein